MEGEEFNGYGCIVRDGDVYKVERKIDKMGKILIVECVSDGVELRTKEDAVQYLVKCTVENKKSEGSVF